MGPARGPGPRRLHAAALAEHVPDRRFHDAGADPLARPGARAIRGHDAPGVLAIRGAFRHGFQALPGRALAPGGPRGVQGHRDGLRHRQGGRDVPRPHNPCEAVQGPSAWVAPRIVPLLLPALVRDALRGRLEHGQPQRHLHPSEQGLRRRVQGALARAPRVAASAENGALLAELVAVRLEPLEEPPLGVRLLGRGDGNAWAGDGGLGLPPWRDGQEALPGDDLKPPWLRWGPALAPIAAHGEGPLGDRHAAPPCGTALAERPRRPPSSCSTRSATVKTGSRLVQGASAASIGRTSGKRWAGLPDDPTAAPGVSSNRRSGVRGAGRSPARALNVLAGLEGAIDRGTGRGAGRGRGWWRSPSGAASYAPPDSAARGRPGYRAVASPGPPSVAVARRALAGR
jgi:hypothetical protein